MTRRQALGFATDLLSDENIPDASTVAEVLLRHALKLSRVELYVSLDENISPGEQTRFQGYVTRVLRGEPAAYVTGHREFYGLDFHVDAGCLIPRPETEILVERAVAAAKTLPEPVIVDVGAGCGAIAVSLAVELPRALVYAVDLSESALSVARRNCERHGVSARVRLLFGDLLGPVPERADLVVANLPYVRTADMPLVTTLGFEPDLALHGGADGLDVIRRLATQSAEKLKAGGSLLLEIGAGQAEAVRSLLRGLFHGSCITIIPDWNGIPRVIVAATQAPDRKPEIRRD